MAWAQVQAWKSVKGIGATSYNLAYTSSITAGSHLPVACSSWVQALDAGTVTDNKGQTYQRAIRADGGNPEVAIFYCENAAAGATTVTVNATGGANDGCLAIGEYSGLPTSSSLDQTASSTGTDSTYETGTTPTLAAANELCIAAAASEGTSGTPTVNSPFTMQVNIITTANMPLLVAEASNPSTTGLGTVFNANTQPWAGCIAVFKLAGGAVDPFPLLPGHGTSPLYRM